MILRIGVTQETMKNIDPSDTMIHTDIIKAIKETALDGLIDSRDMNHEDRTDADTTRRIVMTAHAHQVVFDLEMLEKRI